LTAQAPDLVVVPCLVVADVAAAFAFLEAAFGATGRNTVADAEGAVRELDLVIGGTVLRLVGADRGRGVLGPESFGGAAVQFLVQAADLAATVARAEAAGGVRLAFAPAADQAGVSVLVRDPSLHLWHLVARPADGP
jgi:PhnB protein